jgi:hypothetical protein
MAKIKLKYPTTDHKKVEVAAALCDVKIKDGMALGDQAITEVEYKTPADLFAMGRTIALVTGKEFDKEEAPTETAGKKSKS